MKKIVILGVVFIVVSFTTLTQIGIGIGTTSPDPSAALDITSTIQGLLPPRMTQEQMNAIASPAEGLMLFCLDCTPKTLFINNGSDFINLINGESITTTTAIAAIVTASTNPAIGGTPSLADLIALGVIGVTEDQTAYEEAIADADPAPTTLAELQAIINEVNSNDADVPGTGF